MNIKKVRNTGVALAIGVIAFISASCLPVVGPKSSAKAITAFGFPAQSAVGVINESAGTISVPVPFGTNVSALVAGFVSTGVSIEVGSTAQVSGTTPNDYNSPVTYSDLAADGSSKDYVVTVTPQPSSAKAITAFGFPALSAVGVIDEAGGTIAVSVPYGTDLTTLVAVYATTGAVVSVSSTTQVNNSTVNNFSSPVTYVVTAADSTTKSYVVTVTPLPTTAKALTAFSFASPNATGVINEGGGTIAVSVPYGTALTSLVASFTTTGVSVKVSSTVQVSGTTANNFSSPVTYVVTAGDASTKSYVVTVTTLPNTAKALTAFSFASPSATGVINEGAGTIAVSVPYGTVLTSLVASFTTTGASVKVGSTVQVSGTTANNFSSTVTYIVTAADASTKNYAVTVTPLPNPAKALTAFSFASPNATGVINEGAGTIAVSVPYGTVLSSLVASFTTTGASVKVGSTVQVSGTTANNFSSAVTYVVTAADASTKNYIVTVTPLPSPAKALTAFSFASLSAVGAIDEAGGTISVTVPFGTDVTSLVASFTTTGASVKVGSTVQVSGTTANDFTSAVMYVVTAADAGTKSYVVTVSTGVSLGTPGSGATADSMPASLMPYLPDPVASIVASASSSASSVSASPAASLVGRVGALPPGRSRSIAGPSGSFFTLPTDLLLAVLPVGLSGVIPRLVDLSGLHAPVAHGSFTLNPFTIADQNYVKARVPTALQAIMRFPSSYSWSNINWSTTNLFPGYHSNALSFVQLSTDSSGDVVSETNVVHWHYEQFSIDDNEIITPPSGPSTSSEFKLFYDDYYKVGGIELSVPASGLTLWIETEREIVGTSPISFTSGAWIRLIIVSSSGNTYFEIYSDSNGGALLSGSCTMDATYPWLIVSKTQSTVDAFDSTGAWSDPSLAQNSTYVSKADNPGSTLDTNIDLGGYFAWKGGIEE